MHQSLSGPETVELARVISASKTFDPLYALFDYGKTETVLTNAERSQILDFRIAGGVTKLVYVFVVDQRHYEPLKLAYRMLMETKDIDASIESFRTRENAERYLFELLDNETKEQHEL